MNLHSQIVYVHLFGTVWIHSWNGHLVGASLWV